MNILDAARRTVRHYPGGLDAVAARLGKTRSTLEKELRGAAGFKLAAIDAAEIVAMATEAHSEHALDIANAVAAAGGAVVIPLPGTGSSDAATMQQLAAVMRETAEVVQAATDAAADGCITQNELRAVEGQVAEMVAAAQGLVAHLGAMHEAGKPAHLQAVEGRRAA